MKRAFGEAETLLVNDTYQYSDYTKYVVGPMVDVKEKTRRRDEEFPKDCKKAFEMGARFAFQINISSNK